MKCSICGRDAVTIDIYSKKPLCKRCFIKNFERAVKRTLAEEKFEIDDRILLALSGGKDSSVMTYVVSKIEEKFPKSEVIAVTLDEGIQNYSSEGITLAKKLTKRLHIEHKIYSYKELFGYTIDEIAQKRVPYKLCTFCGVFRRRALEIIGRKIGATKIAVGHTLSDEAQTFIMNILRGERTRFYHGRIEGFIPRAKPLKWLTEREVTLYAYFIGINFQERRCPYSHEAFREPIRRFVLEMEYKYPFSLRNSIEIRNSIFTLLSKQKPPLEQKRCKICGFPSSTEICRVCQLRNLLEEK